MGVVYRAIWDDARQELFGDARSKFEQWLASKQINLELPEDGEVSEGGLTLRTLRVSDDNIEAVRFDFTQDSPEERWKTTLIAMTDGTNQHLWVDLEWDCEDVYARPPDLGSPRIVRELIDDGTATIGGRDLRTNSSLKGSDDVPGLLDDITGETREIPIVVFAMANGQRLGDLQSRSDKTAAALAGVADVILLVSQAVPRFNDAIGDELAVFPGALRTYLPGARINDPLGFRHRYITRSRVERHERAAARILARELFSRAASARPPILYRERIHGLLRTSGDGGAVWDLADELDGELKDVRSRLEQTVDDLELERLEHDETLAQLQAAQARVRFLEIQLADVGRPQFDSETPPEEVPSSAESCEQVVEQVRSHLPFVHLPEHACPQVEYLDGFPNASKWAKKAWSAFRALNAYGQAKADGLVSSDFRGANDSGILKTYAIPGSQVTMHESETTDNNPGFRGIRTFDVGEDVDPSGRVYMPAHIKLQAGGIPAPRIHFHDDTSGTTGKVHVGWFGDHLANKQTG